MSQPFHSYNWLKPKKLTFDDIQLANEMLLQDVEKLHQMHNILERFKPLA